MKSSIFSSKIQTVSFTNDDTGKTFNVCLSDIIEVFVDNGDSCMETPETFKVECFSLKNTEVVIMYEGVEVYAEEIISINDIKI